MLKHIAPSQLRLGMYIHGLDGSWLEHNFWRSSFLLKTSADLQRLQTCGIAGLWIDVTRGLDVEVLPSTASVPAAPATPSPATPSAAAPPPAEQPAAPPAPGLWPEEVERARQQCQQAQVAVMHMFHEARMGRAIRHDQAEALAEQIQDSVTRHPAALISVARLKSADTYTFMHSVAVSALMVALAQQLGLPAQQVKRAALAGLLHDLGKAHTRLDILNKPGALTDEEFAHMKLHPVQGHAMLLESISDAEVLDACLHHHERLDGRGYPHGLCAEQIHLMARMTAICDVYDAITSNRPYKSGWSPAIALQRMAQWCGAHLDAHIFSAFVKTLGVYPVGSLLRLHSGRLALVFALSENKLLTPQVVCFYDTDRQQRIDPPVLLDLSTDPEEHILRREDPEDWNFSDLDDLWQAAITTSSSATA